MQSLLPANHCPVVLCQLFFTYWPNLVTLTKLSDTRTFHLVSSGCVHVWEGGAGNNRNVNLTPGIQWALAQAHNGSIMLLCIKLFPLLSLLQPTTLTTRPIQFNSEPLLLVKFSQRPLVLVSEANMWWTQASRPLAWSQSEADAQEARLIGHPEVPHVVTEQAGGGQYCVCACESVWDLLLAALRVTGRLGGPGNTESGECQPLAQLARLQWPGSHGARQQRPGLAVATLCQPWPVPGLQPWLRPATLTLTKHHTETWRCGGGLLSQEPIISYRQFLIPLLLKPFIDDSRSLVDQ